MGEGGARGGEAHIDGMVEEEWGIQAGGDAEMSGEVERGARKADAGGGGAGVEK
jgi:hypothetical protein